VLDSRPPRSRLFGWLTVLVGAVALGSAIVAVSLFVRSLEGDSVRVDENARQVALSADRTYGIYVDDADNSGYTQSCSVHDSRGRAVPLRDPGWSASTSDTETLALVFDTGTGDLTISCTIPGEQVTAKPVPNVLALVLGIVVAGILGVAALGFLIVWLLARSSRPATHASW
jgi:hypothetical protein